MLAGGSTTTRPIEPEVICSMSFMWVVVDERAGAGQGEPGHEGIARRNRGRQPAHRAAPPRHAIRVNPSSTPCSESPRSLSRLITVIVVGWFG